MKTSKSDKILGTVIGSFGKGTKGAVAVNFAPSGGANCSDSCSLKNNGCYAQTVEKMKSSITKNLVKKQANLTHYLRALNARKAVLKSAPWVRFSAFGSVPESLTREQLQGFQDLAQGLDLDKVHFPIENLSKAITYRALGFRPRLSLGLTDNPDHIANSLESFPMISLTYGETRSAGKNNRNTPGAKAFAKKLNSQGIKAIVCPAIAANSKCGECRACASPKVQAVIYPFHV